MTKRQYHTMIPPTIRNRVCATTQQVQYKIEESNKPKSYWSSFKGAVAGFTTVFIAGIGVKRWMIDHHWEELKTSHREKMVELNRREDKMDEKMERDRKEMREKMEKMEKQLDERRRGWLW